MNNCSTIKKPTATSILCELARLKSQQNFLQKTQSSIQMIDVNPSEDVEEHKLLTEIDKLQNYNKTDFPKTKHEAKHLITDIFENITNFETHMMSSDCIRNVHVIAYRDEVIKMDSNLTEISNSISLKNEILKAKYKEIEATLQPTEALLRDIPKHVISKQKSIQDVVKNPISETACAEIKTFDNFLKNCGGHSGSWNDEKHNIYVKFKNKYKSNIERIVECVNIILPGNYTHKIKTNI